MTFPELSVMLFFVCPTVLGIVCGMRAKPGWLRGIWSALAGIALGAAIATGAPHWIRLISTAAARVIENGGF